MRIQKREWIMLSLLIIMIFITVGLFQLTQIPTTTELTNDQSLEIQVSTKISTDKETRIYKYAEEMVTQYPIKGVMLLGGKPGIIETDGFNRYYAEFDVVGVNSEQEIGVYTYCMVIQEDQQGEFYVLPYGIEVLYAESDPLKKDIMTSTMKTVNQWGLDVAYTESKTPKVSAASTDINKMYMFQKMNRFIGEFMRTYADALSHKDFNEIAHYFMKDTSYYSTQKHIFDKLSKSVGYCDLREIEILGISALQNKEEFLISVEGRLYAYIEGKINTFEIDKTYEIILKDNIPIIIGERP